MVNTRLKGRPVAVDVTIKMIRDAVDFMVGLLFKEDQDMQNLLCIDIELIDGLIANEHSAGFCEWLDNFRNPTEFRVQLDSAQTKPTMLKSLGHELAHVRQMAMGWKTESIDGTKHRWNGRLIDCENTDYYDLPWEIEAHGLEYGLYDRFIKHENGIVWTPQTQSINKAKVILSPLLEESTLVESSKRK